MEGNTLTKIYIHSFGSKNGAEFLSCLGDRLTTTRVFKLHKLPNPYKVAGLRESDGRDTRVQMWLLGHIEFRDILDAADKEISKVLHPSSGVEVLDLAFCCYGGRHRSPAAAELLYRSLTNRGISATLQHHTLS